MTRQPCQCIFNLKPEDYDQNRHVCEGLCRGLNLDVDEALDLFMYNEAYPYPVVRIPALAVTDQGTLLAASEARESVRDQSARDLLLRRSANQGKTWSDCQSLLSSGDLERFKGRVIHNPTFLPLQGGKVLLFFGLDYEELWMTVSQDDGATFGDAVTLMDQLAPQLDEAIEGWSLLAPGPGQGIQAADGALRLPIWISLDKIEHRPSVVAVLGSDDEGAHWSLGDVLRPSKDATWINPSESTLVQLLDGRYLWNIRHEGSESFRLVTESADGLHGWSTPRLDKGLPDPVCHAAMVRHPSHNWLTFVNCRMSASASQDRRKNLTLHMSIDDGATWPRQITIGVNAGYPALASSPSGNIVYVLFEHGRLEGQGTCPVSLKFVPVHIDKVMLDM